MAGRLVIVRPLLCATASLLPFAVALGIDLTIALMRTLQNAVLGIVAGASFALMEVGAWYGLGLDHEKAPRRRRTPPSRLG